MKRFLLNLSFFLLGVFLFICIIIPFFKLDGYTDPFYLRFTSPKQKSLIIGTSRAAQGILPSIINSELNRDDIYNYSFTILHSPFGKTYLESIEKKCEAKTKEGIYIIAVDPWSVSSNSINPNDSNNFVEIKLAVGKTRYVNLNPNFFYLLQSYDHPLKTLLYKNRDTSMFLHADGWLEVSVPMDTQNVRLRTVEKTVDYNNNAVNFKFSIVRWHYLIQTISFLKSKGNVYLVRLPIDNKIFDIENRYMPDFERRIENLAAKMQIDYLNITNQNDKFNYVDGNHLYKSSGKEVSAMIGQWIKKLNKQQ